MIFCASKEDEKDLRLKERKYYRQLKKGLYVKMSRMLFSGFNDETGSFIKNNSDTNRVLSLNIAGLFLYSPTKKCRFKALQNALRMSSEVFYRKNESLVQEKTKKLLQEGRDYLWHLDQEVNEKQPEEDDIVNRITDVTLDPNEDFSEEDDDINQELIYQNIDGSLNAEIDKYLNQSGLKGKREWEEVTGHISDSDRFSRSLKFQAYWEKMEKVYPRLANIAKYVRTFFLLFFQ
jgi:hypothetical protein